MKSILIKNSIPISENCPKNSDVLIIDGVITNIANIITDFPENTEIIDAKGLFLIPGIIDSHVHFREPGLTQKGDIFSESRAAAAGGVTSFIDMPNTIPPSISLKQIEEKFNIAKEKSLINYSFYIAATNDNVDDLLKMDLSRIAGIKVFMGSSTGNICLNNDEKLEKLFANAKILIATHCEDDEIIKKQLEIYKKIYGDDIPFNFHSQIRNKEACIESTKKALAIADKFKTKLNICHVSTAEELKLIEKAKIYNKNLSAEVCVNYLFFTDDILYKDYNLLKCNPSFKTKEDALALCYAIKSKIIDTIGSDHAPHSFEEKSRNYVHCPSGIPSVQHILYILDLIKEKNILNVEDIVTALSHNPARIFNIEKRGFIKEGYFADLVLVDFNSDEYKIEKSNILYKSNWSPLENYSVKTKVIKTIVNGEIVYDRGNIIEKKSTYELKFIR